MLTQAHSDFPGCWAMKQDYHVWSAKCVSPRWLFSTHLLVQGYTSFSSLSDTAGHPLLFTSSTRCRGVLPSTSPIFKTVTLGGSLPRCGLTPQPLQVEPCTSEQKKLKFLLQWLSGTSVRPALQKSRPLI